MQQILSHIQNARLALSVGDIGSAETALSCAAKLVEEKFTTTNNESAPCCQVTRVANISGLGWKTCPRCSKSL